jgi:DNA-binding CsgD family transcriptional regulator
MNAGQHNYAVELLDQSEPHLPDSYSVAVSHQLRGQLSIRMSQPAGAPALLLEAARLFAPLSAARAREVLLEAFEAYTFSAYFTSGIAASDIASTAHETFADVRSPSLEDRLLIGTTRLVEGCIEEGCAEYREAAYILRTGALTDEQMVGRATFGNSVTNQLFDDAAYSLWIDRVDAYARRNGALLVLLFNLFAQMEDDVRHGDLAAALARHAEALDVAVAVGLPSEYYEPMDVVVKAWAGEEEATKSTAISLIEVSAAVGVAVPVMMGYRALATLHIGRGRYREALEATDYLGAHQLIGWAGISLPLAVEAAIRSGEREAAESAYDQLRAHAMASGSPWGLGLLARAGALLANRGRADTLFRQSIELLSQTSVKTDLAHSRLLYGEWLRREGRQLHARNELREAHSFFTAMGAVNFANRSEAELLAAGERVQPRAARRGAELTPQELRIARSAANRLTNPEIASQLFISSATVDYHLRKVYRKLGIGSRRELGEALRDLGQRPDS